jgi:uncharacterized protein (TIGR03067 family)
MRQLIVFVVLAGFGLAQPSEVDVKKELKLFQGKWKAIAATGFNGEALTDQDLQSTTLVVEGDKFTMKTAEITIEGTFKIDPTRKPKTIDVILKTDKDNPLQGIYEQVGDTRKSCFSERAGRPDGFMKKKGFLYLEWQKVK